jgi:lipopolysaccharide/colanic/teichoic acid biosynthesis glycosyltransferase
MNTPVRSDIENKNDQTIKHDRMIKDYPPMALRLTRKPAKWRGRGQEQVGHRRSLQAGQRVFDILLASLLLSLLFPIFLLITLMICLDTPGPVLFIQRRVGQNGVEFPFFKFRSMVHDAEARRRALEAFNERGGPVFKMRDDPRITRVGGLLRRASLDELPQLLNVLRGEMSLVGPRPALPAEVSQYTARQRERLTALPGVTGLWQVSGRADVPFETAVEMDLRHVREQSLGLYFKVLLLTIPAVISGRGAY